MKKIVTFIIVAMLGVSFFSTVAFASMEGKGNRIFLKKLRKTCGFNGFVMAQKHTQEEWKAISEAGELNNEMESFCPGAKDFKASDEKYVAAFFHSFASNSGAVVAG